MLSPLASAERREDKGGGHKKNERESGIKKGINERRETQMDRLVSSSRQITDRQTDRQTKQRTLRTRWLKSKVRQDDFYSQHISTILDHSLCEEYPSLRKRKHLFSFCSKLDETLKRRQQRNPSTCTSEAAQMNWIFSRTEFLSLVSESERT